MADHDADDARDLEWAAPTPAAIGTLTTDLPEALPPGTLRHTWHQNFGAQEGFGAPIAERRRRRRKRVFSVVLSVVVLLSALAACGVLAVGAVQSARQDGKVRAKANLNAEKGGPRTKVGGSKEESKRDVAVRSCSVNEEGFSSAAVVVTNHSNTTADYVVAVEFDNGYGRRAGTGYVTVSSVEPGSSSGLLSASSYKEAPNAGLTCHVGQVTRLTY
jgi:hypothetical protein